MVCADGGEPASVVVSCDFASRDSFDGDSGIFDVILFSEEGESLAGRSISEFLPSLSFSCSFSCVDFWMLMFFPICGFLFITWGGSSVPVLYSSCCTASRRFGQV